MKPCLKPDVRPCGSICCVCRICRYWWKRWDQQESPMNNLAAGKCVACRAGEPMLTDAEIEDLLPQVHQWQVKEVDGVKRLEKVFKFKNFVEALDFTNKVGAA